MAANKQVIKLLQKQQARLERMIARAGESISGWKGELESLVGAISALGGGGRRGRPKGTGAKGRKRGTWKPGGRGRPPQWFIDQQKSKGKKPGKRAAKAIKGKRRRKASPKQLAAMAKAREALAAKRKAAAKAAS